MTCHRRLIFAAFLLIVLPTPAWAWNKAGHMVTAAIAYDTLKNDNPQALAALVAILKQHPQYQEHFAGQLEKVVPDDRDQALFMYAARWADDIRNNPDYNRSPWHYIDYPYKPQGQPDSVTTADPPDPNLEVAYRTNIEVLKNPEASAADKAVAVCWIMHLTGDSHQPLHSVSLFTTDYPGPKGDQGATKSFVRAKADGEPITLHFFWDGLVTGSEDTRDAKRIAIELRSRYSRDQLDPHPQEVAPSDVAGWIQESFQLAKSDVYREGNLATNPDRDKAPILPDDYIANAKSIGERRVTQSGYRMADILSIVTAAPQPTDH